MIAAAILGLRLPAATVIALMGFNKLASLPDSVRGIWWPGRRGIPVPLLVVISIMEVVVAGIVLVGPAAVAIPTTALALGLLTAYGVFAVRNTGRCGCAGQETRTTPGRLLLRNGALATAALGGEVLAPSLSGGALHAVAPIVGLAPAFLLIGMAAVETARRKITPRIGAAP